VSASFSPSFNCWHGGFCQRIASDFRPASNCPSGQYLPHKIRFPLSRAQRRRRLWVKMRNTRKEQMISALPPTSDIARQPRLTIESHLRLNPPASRCRAAGGCRLSTSPLAGPPAPAPRGLTSRGAHRKCRPALEALRRIGPY